MAREYGEVVDYPEDAEVIIKYTYTPFEPRNDSFSDKIESIQYNAALAITGAIRGTSKDKL